MKQLKHRVLSMLVLAAILVPMVTLGVFAGSRQQPFNFTWSGATASKFSRGNKTDVGDSSAYYAPGQHHWWRIWRGDRIHVGGAS